MCLVPQVDVSAAGARWLGQLLALLCTCRQLESTCERLNPGIEGGNGDALEDPPITIPVGRLSRSTGAYRLEAEVGRDGRVLLTSNV